MIPFQVEEEKAQLKRSLRDIKSDLAKKNEQLTDLSDELSALREASKEREKTLKSKVKEALMERDRLVGVEVSDALPTMWLCLSSEVMLTTGW